MYVFLKWPFSQKQQNIAGLCSSSYVFCSSQVIKAFLPVDIQLQRFDSMVAPILLYGSEVSGFERSNLLESLCLKFYKCILKATMVRWVVTQ